MFQDQRKSVSPGPSVERYRLLHSKKLLLVFSVITIAIWLTALGSGIWEYASSETEPPVFDALSYVQKAQAFWGVIESGEIVNPLSIEPTIRPFGTVLLSYPFGFHDDFRWFYFRSSFIPLVIFTLTCICAVNIYTLSSRQFLFLLIISICASSAPCFYQFQLSQGDTSVSVTWGFVDLLLSSLASLAIAITLRNYKNKSLVGTFFVSIIASSTILIKPSGLLIMAVIGMVWFIFNVPVQRQTKGQIYFFIKGCFIFFVVYVSIFLSIYFSDYFSYEQAKYGLGSMDLIKKMYGGIPSIFEIFRKLHLSVGIIISTLIFYGLAYSFKLKYRRYFVSAIVILLIGLWLWLYKTSINNIRYFLPFLFMSFTVTLPPVINSVKSLSNVKCVIVWMLFLAPTVLVAFLLSTDKPSTNLQHLAGINLTANNHSDEVQLANDLYSDLVSTSEQDNIIYYAGIQPRVRAVQAVLDYDRLIGGSKARTIPALPIDWVREHCYRIDEITRARFIVFELVEAPNQILNLTSKVKTYAEEQLMVRAWLSSLTPEQGIRIHSYTKNVRVIEVMDVGKIENAATYLFDNHTWRKEFTKGFQKRWRGNSEVAQTIEKNSVISEPIDLLLRGKRVATLIGVTTIKEGEDLLIKAYIDHVESLQGASGISDWFLATGVFQPDSLPRPKKNLPLYIGMAKLKNIREYSFYFSGDQAKNISKISMAFFAPNNGHQEVLKSEVSYWHGYQLIFDLPEM